MDLSRLNGREVRIPADIDRRYRAALLEGSKAGGHRAHWHISNALQNGPSRGGLAETLAYFKEHDASFLACTAELVDGLEITVPGFKRWLEATGFGNDVRMVRGFLAWAEHVDGKGAILPNAEKAFLDS
jgi:hypothetical protein